MKKKYPKRVNPKPMITRFQDIFKSVGLKKPTFRNLLLTVIAIGVAKTFRINEIASRLATCCLPREVETEKVAAFSFRRLCLLMP